MKLRELRDTVGALTRNASTNARQLGFTGIALVWLQTDKRSGFQPPELLFYAGCIFVSALACDIAQGLWASLKWQNVLDEKEAEAEAEAEQQRIEGKSMDTDSYEVNENEYTTIKSVNLYLWRAKHVLIGAGYVLVLLWVGHSLIKDASPSKQPVTSESGESSIPQP
jgi:hypothetical protein